MSKEINQTLELIIELVEGLIQEEGFKTLKFSDADNLGTTSYDCLVFKGHKGQEYTITFDKSMTRDKDKFDWHSTNYIR